MITLAILQKMAADGVAGLQTDKTFFWEEAPLQKNGEPAEGVWIVTRGASLAGTPHGLNQRATADFYVAFADKTKTETTLREIIDWIRANLGICELSGTVGDSRYHYENIRIRPTQSPSNQGVTANGLIVKVASAEIYYDQTNQQED